MAPSSLRAKHIVLDSLDGRVFVVYPRDANMVDVNLTATIFETETGIRARALVTRLDNQPDYVPVIMVRPGRAKNAERVLARLRQLVNPELPVAIGSMEIELLRCRCSYLSSKLTDIQFVLGFGPDDDQAFILRYLAAMKKMPVADLLSTDTRPPYSGLMAQLEQVLAGLGAYATLVKIEHRPDPLPCTHPR